MKKILLNGCLLLSITIIHNIHNHNSNNKFTKESAHCQTKANYQIPYNSEKLKKDIKTREEDLERFDIQKRNLLERNLLGSWEEVWGQIPSSYGISKDDLTKHALQNTDYLFLDKTLQKEYLRLLFEDGIENFIRKLDRENMRDIDFNDPSYDKTNQERLYNKRWRALSPIENILYSFVGTLADHHDKGAQSTRVYLMLASEDPENRKDYKLSTVKVAAYLQQYYKEHEDRLKNAPVKDFLKEGIRSYFDEILNDASVRENYNNQRKKWGLSERSQYGYDASPDTN